MFRGSPLGASLLAAVLLPAIAVAVGVPAAAPGMRRVLVFDIQAKEVAKQDLAEFPDLLTQLPGLIGEAVAAHGGFEVIPTAELHRAIQANKTGCAASEACRWRVAHELHAGITLFGSVVKQPHGYTLFLTRTDATEKESPRGNSQDMKKFKSLPLNATLCLNHLFGWHDASSPAIATRAVALPEPVTPETAAASPPKAPEVKVPPPPAPAVKPPVPVSDLSKHRVLIASTAEVGLDREAVTAVPGIVAAQFAQRPGFTVISDAEMNTALKVHEAGHPHCRESEACLAAIGRKLRAEVVVGSTFRKESETYEIELRRIDPTGARATRSATETMHKQKSLALNIALCFEKLFPPDKSTPPVTAAPATEITIGPITLSPGHGVPKRLAAAPEQAAPVTTKPPPAPADEAPTLAVLGNRGGIGFEAELAGQARDAIITALQPTGRFHVLSESALNSLLGLDPALADAPEDLPGVRYLGAIDISRSGGAPVVLLKLLDVKQGIVVARVQEALGSSEELPRIAERIVADVLQALAPETDAAARAFDEARQADRDGTLSSDLYRNALAADPADARAALQLALQLRFEDPAEAHLQLQAAVQHHDRLSPAGQALLDAADPYLRDPIDWEEVERRLVEASKKFPADAGLLLFLGTARSNQGRYAEALTTFEQAAKLDADEPGVLLDEAQAAAHLHHIDDALVAVSRCLLVSPFAAGCSKLRVTLLQAKGDWAEVEREARYLIAVDPSAPGSYSALVQALAARGAPAATIAATLARRLQFVGGDKERQERWDNASLALYSGDFAAAESKELMLWEDGRGRPALYDIMDPASALFALYREMRRLDDAANLAEKTEEVTDAMAGNDQDWGPIGTRWTLTYERFRAGQATGSELDSARGTFLNAPTNAQDKDRVRRWRWLRVYGRLVLAKDEAEAALAALPELAKNPAWNESDAGEECPVGHVLFYAGKTVQAIPLLENCLRTRSGFWDVLDCQQYRLDLARAYESTGRKEEGRALAQKILERWSDPKLQSRTATAARDLLGRTDGAGR